MDSFTAPEFLSEQDVNTIHQEMLNDLPEDIDKSEGQFAWDFTRPTAIEKSQFSQFQLSEAIKLIFPQFAYGKWLDYHAANRGITRKAGTKATGTVTVTGTAGESVPNGSMFSTQSINGAPSITFVTTAAAEIGAGGTIDIAIEASNTGESGNVSANTITMKGSNLTFVTAVTNAAATTGGTEVEDDDTLRERITDYDSTQGLSFVGSVSDYKRWAESVDGTGDALVIPANDTTGLVTIVLTDSAGAPASADLREDVYNFIMRPDDPYSRLAPINANLSVVAPTLVTITIAATVELASGFTVTDASTELAEAVHDYFVNIANKEMVVRYSEIAKCLLDTDAIKDYKSLLVNNAAANVTLTSTQMPTIAASDITLTEGTI